MRIYQDADLSLPDDFDPVSLESQVAAIMGRDAREAITDYLLRDPESFCFSTAEAMAWRRAVGAAKRTTPLSCGNRPGTNARRRHFEGRTGK